MGQRSLFAEQEKSFGQTLSEIVVARLEAERPERVAIQFITAAHLDAAKEWDDWHECLIWAWETEATVREMEAWRRAFKGESK